MYFHDDALFPECQDKLVITAAPYGPEWEPADFPEDLPLTMDQTQISPQPPPKTTRSLKSKGLLINFL